MGQSTARPVVIPMIHFAAPRWLVFSFLVVFTACGPRVAAAPDQAEQLRIIAAMAEKLRERIDELPLLLPAGHAVAQVNEITVTLNQQAVVVDGQRFDGIVVVAPAEKASFGWAFASPPNLAGWYILRAEGEMKGFANFLPRPRGSLPTAAEMKPTEVPTITFQKLDSGSWVAGERYILWFRFKDDTPTELTLRAGFFAAPSLNNNRLPALLFPAPQP